MNLYFIPSWNGHLYLQTYNDNSVTKLYDLTKSKDKKLIMTEKNNIEKTNEIIQSQVNFDSFTLSVTGDHSNTYSLVKKFAKNNKNFNLVIFDAHPDVEVGTDLVSHEDYLRQLIEEGIVLPKHVYLFGIRAFSRLEFEYLKEKGVNYFTITDVLENTAKVNKILSKLKNVYLSIDIDVLDPDIAPGTYYTQWCGLNLKELNDFISILKPNLNAVDITEYYSEKDDEDKTKNLILNLVDFFFSK